MRKKRTAEAYVGTAKGVKAEALRQAGYQETTATHQQARTFRDPALDKEIKALLAAAGLDDQTAVRKHAELLEARFTKFFQDREIADCTDNDAQLKALELYYAVTGRLRQRVEIDVVIAEFVERVVQVVVQHVPAAKRGAVMDSIIRDLQVAGRS